MSAPPPLRAYRGLLRLYPRRFREEYGADMVQLLRDQYRDESHARVLGRAFLDLAITIPNQHLEAHMRHAPTSFGPLLFLAIAVAGLAVAVVGGTTPAALIVGLVVAAGAGFLAVTAWRHAAPAREADVTSSWWKFLVAGPVLVALVIAGAGLGIEAWFVGVLMVFAAAVFTALGLTLGIAHLATHRRTAV